MPIAKKYSLAEVMEACDFYFQNTGRRITYEYSLIGGVNDTDEDAAQIAGLLRRNHSTIRSKYRRALKKLEQELVREDESGSRRLKSRRKEVQR